MLTRDQILKASRPATVDVDVPSLGGTVRVRAMTAADYLLMSSLRQKGQEWALPTLARCVVDDGGNALFSESEIGVLPMDAADALMTAMLEVSGLSGSDTEKN